MTNRIQNFLQNLSFEELQEAYAIASNLIHKYKDGFSYECRVRSYGRNWTEHLTNQHTVQELCHQYAGDDGIVDVYTTNPDLRVGNYGDTLYFPTLEDAEVWRSHRYLTNAIPRWKEEIQAWENRDSLPFRERPTFAPYMDEAEIASREAQLLDLTQKLVQPVRLYYNYEEDTNLDT
jgi:uncharacterized protein YecE (DUF72 family)